MTLFWIISAAMIIAALVFIAPPLLRKHAAAVDATETLNVEIARERLDELVKQRDSGDISDEEFEQAKRDLELALAEDLQTSAAPQPRQTTGDGRVALLISALLIPLITIPLYFEIGSPQLIAPTQTAAATSPHGGDAGQLPPMSELAEELRKRMLQNPDNAEGWFLLGRTYMRLQDYGDAVEAFERVVDLLPEEPAGLLSLAFMGFAGLA
jgi:cytochrome c-type biogenesis protein CcmH